MTYRIDKGVPMTKPRCERRRKYPVRELKVGDSFLVPEKDVRANIAQAVRNVATAHGFKVAARKMPDGVRFWRVK